VLSNILHLTCAILHVFIMATSDGAFGGTGIPSSSPRPFRLAYHHHFPTICSAFLPFIPRMSRASTQQLLKLLLVPAGALLRRSPRQAICRTRVLRPSHSHAPYARLKFCAPYAQGHRPALRRLPQLERYTPPTRLNI